MNQIGNLESYVERVNARRAFFTPGPPSLSAENLSGLGPAFGRGDVEYTALEDSVLERLKKISGQSQIIRFQGSGSLALEIVAMNFLYGRVVIVDTGYYSRRLHDLALSALKQTKKINAVFLVPSGSITEFDEPVDWVWACAVETSIGKKMEISQLRLLADRCGAQLAIDATASIGLESDHYLADVCSYSSCKGLFGLTGAAFVSYNEDPKNDVDSFNLSVETHKKRAMTGPYHSIQSLHHALLNREELKSAVIENKRRFIHRMEPFLTEMPAHQPLICTRVSIVLTSRTGSSVLYEPRSQAKGTVVAHLGEVYLGTDARGEILDDLIEVTSS